MSAADEPLLAQQLLLLSISQELAGEPTGWSNLQGVVIGSLVAELADRERVVVDHSTALDDHTIDILDGGPTGDEVLDQALRALGGGRVGAHAKPVSAGLRMYGSRARRRLRSTGRVQHKDVMRWWEGCWRCHEFPELAPTLLRQLLTLYEELWGAHRILHERIGADGSADDLGVGPGPGREVRERLRPYTLGELDPPDARMRYVVALCGGSCQGWLREGLSNDPAERESHWVRGQLAIAKEPLARTVALVVDRYEAQFDAMP